MERTRERKSGAAGIPNRGIRVPLEPAAVARPGGRRAPRRARTARDTVIVVLVALLVGAVLDAESIERTAESQPYGWRRSLATTAAAPATFLAEGLRLSAARDGIQTAMGHEDEEPAAVAALPSPFVVFDDFLAKAGAEIAKMPQPAPRRNVVWVGGDSMANDVARAFQRAQGESGPEFVENTRISTGLARPDVHDWVAAIETDMREVNPDVAVFCVGGNDDQDMQSAGGRVTLGTEAWKAEYRRRVGAAMDALSTEGRKVIWVGYPIVRDKDLAESLDMIETLQKAEAEMRPSVTFVSLWDRFADENGLYVDWVADTSGELQRMRRGDGVHMTPVGGDFMFIPILAAVEQVRSTP